MAVTGEGRTKQETIQKLQGLHETANDWAKCYASIFAPNKYKLIHFINSNAPSNPRDAEEPVLMLLLMVLTGINGGPVVLIVPERSRTNGICRD